MDYIIKVDKSVINIGYYQGTLVIYRVVHNIQRMECEEGWAEAGTIRYKGQQHMVFRYQLATMERPIRWRTMTNLAQPKVTWEAAYA